MFENQADSGNKDIIGIYPEWNVKIDLKMKSVQNPPIGIYPEWNVKLS